MTVVEGGPKPRGTRAINTRSPSFALREDGGRFERATAPVLPASATRRRTADRPPGTLRPPREPVAAVPARRSPGVGADDRAPPRRPPHPTPLARGVAP